MTTDTSIQINDKSLKLKNGLTMAEDLFCIYFIESGNEHKAYKHAFEGAIGPCSPVESLFENPLVIARIEQLYNRRIELMEVNSTVNIDRLTKMLEVARIGAMEAGQFSAAVTATMSMAKLAGLIVDKSQISVKRVDEMTEDELRYIVNGTAKDVTPPHEGKG